MADILNPARTAAVLERPGARLAYEVAGEGPAVVLVHGFGLDMRMWDPQAGPLATRFLVVRYDCRGFGASGPFDPAVPYTHAGDLVALLDHLHIDDAVVVGLSFGGRVALQAALADPARIRGLALLDAVLDGVPWDPESARALDEVARPWASATCRASARCPRCSPGAFPVPPTASSRTPVTWSAWSSPRPSTNC